MPTFARIIDSIRGAKESTARRQQLIVEIERLTGRRLLVYAAAVQKPGTMLSFEDKTGFSDLMENVEEKHVDFLVNSPGGFAEATEVCMHMLRARFESVRFAVPNAAKSAATLLVLSGDELLMDHRSELGPIDPQIEYSSIDGRKREAAADIIDGFEEAKEALKREGPAATPAYVPLLSKYSIGLLRGCRNAQKLSQELAEEWLRTYMFKDDPQSSKPQEIARFLSSRNETLSHNRAIGIEKCMSLGMRVVDLREEQNLELGKNLWELWCLYELHFERTPVYKVYENCSGCLLQKQRTMVQVRPASPSPPGEPPA